MTADCKCTFDEDGYVLLFCTECALENEKYYWEQHEAKKEREEAPDSDPQG